MSNYKILTLLLVTFALNACIWGSGSENSPVFYNGKTTPAIITAENGKEIAINGMSSQSLGGTGALLSGADIVKEDETLSPVPLPVRIAQSIKIIAEKQQTMDFPTVTVSGATTTVRGSCGGSATTDVDANFNFRSTFDDYCEGSGSEKFIISGSMTLTNSSFSYEQLRIRGAGFDVSMNGDMTFTSNFGNLSGSFSFTTNMDMRNNFTGEVSRLENYEVSTNTSSDNFQLDISGRVYQSSYGYVDIETITPISFDVSTGEMRGKMRFRGQNSSVTLEFLGDGFFRITVENSGRVISTENVTFEDIFAEL